MTIQTLIAKLINSIPGLSSNLDKLNRLKLAAEKDYSIVVSSAEHALAASISEVSTMATSELAALKASTTALAARAEALIKADVLKVEHAVEASVLGKVAGFVEAEFAKLKAEIAPTPAPVPPVTAPIVAPVDLTKTAA